MSPIRNFLSILEKVEGLLPAFISLSFVGCITAKFLLKAPPDAVAVVVAIPAVGLLTISRLLTFLIPGRPALKLSDVPRPVLLASAAISLLAICALDILISGLVLSYIGLPGIAFRAYRLVVACAVILLLGVVGLFILLWPDQAVKRYSGLTSLTLHIVSSWPWQLRIEHLINYIKAHSSIHHP